MHGKLTGCCPGDLVQQVYTRLDKFFSNLCFSCTSLHSLSYVQNGYSRNDFWRPYIVISRFTCTGLYSSGKLKASNGITGLHNPVSQGSSCKLRGQSCYLEVTIGCSNAESDKMLQANLDKNISGQNISESCAVTRKAQKGLARPMPVCEKTFIYPAEAVLVPVVQTSFARSSLKRWHQWLQVFKY